jgi:hypothetical protein
MPPVLSLFALGHGYHSVSLLPTLFKLLQRVYAQLMDCIVKNRASLDINLLTDHI